MGSAWRPVAGEEARKDATRWVGEGGGGGGDVSQSEIREGSKRTNQSAVVRSFGTCNFGPIFFFLGNLHHLSGDAPRRYLVRSLGDRGSRRGATLISKSGDGREDTGRANTDLARLIHIGRTDTRFLPSRKAKDEEVIENISNSSQGIKIHNRTLTRPPARSSLMRHLLCAV